MSPIRSDPGFPSPRMVPIAIVKIKKRGLFARVGAGSARPDFELTLEMLLALEVLLFEPDCALAASEFDGLRQASVPDSVSRLLDRLELTLLKDPTHRGLLLQQRELFLMDDVLQEKIQDLTIESRATRQVLRALGLRHGLSPQDRVSFVDALTALTRAGFVTPAPGHVDWGDFKRLVPLCPRFGLGRGTPVDRYYLDRFVDGIRPEVQGDVVDLGGLDTNRVLYAFSGVTRYRGFDRKARAEVSLVGDAHDSDALPEQSLDAVVAFNVLEHCEKPWVVVENMRRWLRPNGKVFCMVPSAQRLHRLAEDYWRPLPAGLSSLFAGFSQRKLRVYGNPLTTLASLFGISAEELSQRELDAAHPDYPVATCMVAIK